MTIGADHLPPLIGLGNLSNQQWDEYRYIFIRFPEEHCDLNSMYLTIYLKGNNHETIEFE